MTLAPLAPHNRQNALTAVEVARRRGHSPEAIAAALPGVVAQLPDRRFQQVWPVRDGRSGNTRRETRAETQDERPETSRLSTRASCPDPLVFTDYAHHPTEMACAVAMARRAASGRVVVLFQPHRYSRTKALLNEFPKAFAAADEVILLPTYAAFEKPVAGGDITDLHAACRAAFAASERAPRLQLATSLADGWDRARRGLKPGDVVLLLGAGDLVDLIPEIRRSLAGPSVAAETEN